MDRLASVVRAVRGVKLGLATHTVAPVAWEDLPAP